MTAGLYFKEVRLKHNLLRFLFDQCQQSREPYLIAKAAVSAATDGKDPLDYYSDVEFHKLYEDRSIKKTQYEDTASALVLMSSTTLERLYNATGDSLFARGQKVYNGTYFSIAVCSLANQFKHLGEWIHQPEPKQDRDKQIVEALVDDALRSDACAEFLTRCAFSGYDEYERSLLDCGSGFETDELSVVSSPGPVRVDISDPHGYFREPDAEVT